MRLLNAIAGAAALRLGSEWAQDAPAKMEELLRVQAPPGQSRYEQLIAHAGGGAEIFALLLELAVGQAVSPPVRESLAGWGGVTVELAASLLGVEPDWPDMHAAYRAALEYLHVTKSAEPFFRHIVAADERLLDYISGGNAVDPQLGEKDVHFLALPRHPLYARQSELSRLCTALGDKKSSLIHFSGENGSGRRFMLAHVCARLGLAMLMADYRVFAGQAASDAEWVVRALRREALFSGAGICLYGIDETTCPNESALAGFIRNYLHGLEGLPQPVCVCTDRHIQIIPMVDWFVDRIELGDLTRGERIALWEGHCLQTGLGDLVDWEAAGAKFRLTPKEIFKAVNRLAARRDDGPCSEQEVADACETVLPPPAQGSIHRIETRYTLDDLKLPDAQKRRLHSLCAHVRHRRQVYDAWGMEWRYSYGKGVSALFVGPPGTGKTMAAHAIANELSIPLYRIDLSQVVDKYIGETEKRLEEIFSASEKSNTILFFDEADSIFGKRSEVNDAKDKYANTEVSYILQRIELYEGIVILATNYRKNIDEAFMRRMRYLVEFHLPGEAQRLELWQAAFAREVPLENVDFAYLARQFELSGGAIGNIALNTSFLAADEGTAVTMRHILEGVRNENLKLGKSMLKQDFAEYGFLSTQEQD